MGGQPTWRQLPRETEKSKDKKQVLSQAAFCTPSQSGIRLPTLLGASKLMNLSIACLPPSRWKMLKKRELTLACCFTFLSFKFQRSQNEVKEICR
jgi:hypothetical protein